MIFHKNSEEGGHLQKPLWFSTRLGFKILLQNNKINSELINHLSEFQKISK